MDATIERPTLIEIEQHIARLYATGLTLATETTSNPSPDLLAHILREAETINELVRRIDPLVFDLDTTLDVAVILSRALNVWNVSVRRWMAESEHAALATAAKELTDAGLALHDALASGPWVTPEDAPPMPSLPRRVQ